MSGTILVNSECVFAPDLKTEGFWYPELGKIARGTTYSGRCRVPVHMDAREGSLTVLGMAELRLTLPSGKAVCIVIPLNEVHSNDRGTLRVGGTLRINRNLSILCEGRSKKSRQEETWNFILDTIVLYRPSRSSC